eukprot:jgi/Ulvmu1/895/UM101_0002.1
MPQCAYHTLRILMLMRLTMQWFMLQCQRSLQRCLDRRVCRMCATRTHPHAPSPPLRGLLLAAAAALGCAPLLAAARLPPEALLDITGGVDTAAAHAVDQHVQSTWRSFSESGEDDLAGGSGRHLLHTSGCHKRKCMLRCPRCRVATGATFSHCKTPDKYYNCMKRTNWSSGGGMMKMVTMSMAGSTSTPAPPAGGAGYSGAFVEEADNEGEYVYYHDSDAYEVLGLALVKWDTGKDFQD